MIFHQDFQDALQEANDVQASGLRSLSLDVVDEVDRLQRIGILAQEIDERLNAAAQNPTKIGQGHEAGMKQVPAVALDESAHVLPFFGAKFFHDGDAQGLTMLYPELEKRLCKRFNGVCEPGGAAATGLEAAR